MVKKPIAWIDSPVYTKERQILTSQTLQVPGLRMIGHHSTAHAIAALDSHYHEDCFEFTYFLHGNVRFSVGGHSYPLSGGDLFVTFPNEVHDHVLQFIGKLMGKVKPHYLPPAGPGHQAGGGGHH